MRVEINNDYTQLYEDNELTNQVQTSYVTNAFYGMDAPTMGLLPPAVRWISPYGNAFLVERPPSKQSISFLCSEGNIKVYNVSLPWTSHLIVFEDNSLLKFKEMKIFARPGPIISASDAIGRLPLTNIDDNDAAGFSASFLSMYSGWVKEMRMEDKLTIGGVLQYVMAGFWSNAFNGSITEDHMPFDKEAFAGPAAGWYEHLTDTPILDTTLWNYRVAKTELSVALAEASQVTQHETTKDFFQSIIGRILRR